jgi:hexosaminidase
MNEMIRHRMLKGNSSTSRCARWMRKLAFVSVATFVLCACQPAATIRHESPALSLLPQPSTVERKPGTFRLREGAALIVDSRNAEAADIARRFAALLAETRGIHLDVRPFGDASAPHDAIVFSLAADERFVPSGEGYDIAIDARRINVRAREPRGLYYGSVTLWQVLTQETTHVSQLVVPQLHISDQPRFAWRGALLDSARHYQSPEFIKRFIDQIALLKLNTLHWHLTDDQGWRIEIKRYPKLTEIGAWRRPAGAAGTDAQGNAVRYGGYYTQDEIRDIVRYASERNVTIVPEIDMPGHMQAAIAAYPELGSLDDAPSVSPDWGVHAYLVNVDESTLQFIENVLDEVVALFPGPIIHIGGDETIKDQWKASPRVRARKSELGIADETALQGWFVARIAEHLATHGRRVIGWDEILEGGIPANAIVMSWRGAQGGIHAAQAGHDVVMVPSPDVYLDHLQGDAADEPPGRPDARTLADLYAFEPIAPGMSADAAAHVLGAEAALWTEHMRTPARVEYAAFPRLDALAEVLWSPPSSHGWHGFIERLVAQMDRHRALGIHPSDSVFEVRIAENYDAAKNTVTVALSNQAGLPIRYTTNGSEPDASAPLYRSPLQLPVPSSLRATTFAGERALTAAHAREFTRATLLHRTSAELKQCSGSLTLRLEDDAPADDARAIFNVDLFNPCWIWPAAPLDGISGIAVSVGRIPYNFQLAADVVNIVPRPIPASTDGELLVKRDSCTGATLATIPLGPAAVNPGLTTLSAAWPAVAGAHDLCFQFASRGVDPLWVIDSVRLVSATP